MHHPTDSSGAQPAARLRRAAIARIVAGAALLAALPAIVAAGPGPEPAPTSAAVTQADGQRVYSQTCAACHQTTGQGITGAFPPLGGSEWVTGDKGHLVRIIMHGLTGPVMVAGEEYVGMMPPWGGALGDAEIAAVATYVRASWGNQGDAVTTAEVTAIRQGAAGRATPWTAAELMAAVASK